MNKLRIETMAKCLQDIENTNQHIPLLGYLVMYDRGMFAFGKVQYIASENFFLEIPLKFIYQYCTNHDVSLCRKVQIPIKSLEVSVKGRSSDPYDVLMKMVVNNLSIMRKRKKILKKLSYFAIGFDEKLEAYEQYYKELTKIEQMKGRCSQ